MLTSAVPLDNRATGTGLDWSTFLSSVVDPSRDELDLRKMKPLDRVLVRTKNTAYLLIWRSDAAVELISNSGKGPQGKVQIMGSTYGLSSSIRPDFLTCGANMELSYNEGNRTWTTSPIFEIRPLRATPNLEHYHERS